MDLLKVFASIGSIGLIGLGLLSATAALCWIKGGPAERLGMALYGGAWVGVLVWEAATGDSTPTVTVLWLDALVSLGFLLLALRYSSLWLGAAMILQGTSLGLHATHLTEISDGRLFGLNGYVLGVNLISLAILLVFVGAAFASIYDRRRRRRRAELTEARFPPVQPLSMVRR